MAPELNLNHEGTSTQYFNTGAARIFNYLPHTPDQAERAIVDESDGGESAGYLWRNVRESAAILYDSEANARTALLAINRMFEAARLRQANRSMARIFVEYRPQTTENLYRSELLGGRAEVVDRLARRVSITWTRRYFWEETLETALTLNNDVGGNAAAVTLHNYFRAADSRSNYAWIAANSVQGDLPTPARVELLNTYNSGTRTGTLYLAHAVDPGALAHIIETESGVMWNGSAVAASGSASGGQIVNLAANSTAETLAWTTALSTANQVAGAGRAFRLLAFVSGAATAADIKIRAKISIDGFALRWRGPWVPAPGASGDIIDLGRFVMPSMPSPYPLRIELHTKRASAGNASVPIDFLQLTPLDGWRCYRSNGYDLAYNAALQDDPYGGQLYTSGWSGGTNIDNYDAISRQPIMLRPGRMNTLYLLVSPTSAILRTTQLKVWYRKRRLQI